MLAAVNDGRVKARNTAKNSLVLEYVKALELYRDSNTSYYISGASPVCIGYLASENCLGSSLLTGSSGFNASLSTYLPSDFAHKQSLMNGTTDYRGVTYQSLDGNSYVLRWILESNITQCINNSTSGSSGGNTVCTYTIN